MNFAINWLSGFGEDVFMCSTYSLALVLGPFEVAIVRGKNSILDHLYMDLGGDTEKDGEKSCFVSRPSPSTYIFYILCGCILCNMLAQMQWFKLFRLEYMIICIVFWLLKAIMYISLFALWWVRPQSH